MYLCDKCGGDLVEAKKCPPLCEVFGNNGPFYFSKGICEQCKKEKTVHPYPVIKNEKGEIELL